MKSETRQALALTLIDASDSAEPYSFSIGSDGQPFLFVQDC